MKRAPILFKDFFHGRLCLLCLLLLAGCSNALFQASRTAVELPTEIGTGRLYIALAGIGMDQGERTLFPGAPASFSKYELAFTPGSGQEAIPPVTLTGGNSHYSLTLTTGDWIITALAYTQIQGVAGITNGDYVAARGEKAVTISPTSTVSEIIDLRGGVDEGQGVFHYTIAMPSGLDSATLDILRLNGNLVKSVNLKTASFDSFALVSGFYLLKISRVKYGNATVRTEVIHIYESWTTEAEYDFTGLGSAAEILGFLSSKGPNTAGSP
jgi:hypothetical protein